MPSAPARSATCVTPAAKMTRPASAALAWAMQAIVVMAMKVALRSMIFFLICHY